MNATASDCRSLRAGLQKFALLATAAAPKIRILAFEPIRVERVHDDVTR
jgi:hypothetical protein